ncbi:MAG TPA: hypothetical protein VF406_20080 [Thermodesulfobacteriota bacterium]
MTPPAANPLVRQEKDRLSWRALLAILAVALVVGGAGVLASWRMALRYETPPLGQPASVNPASPRDVGMIDQTLIERDRYGQRLAEAKRRELSRYGWADRRRGLARIPIDEAMRLVVEEARR